MALAQQLRIEPSSLPFNFIITELYPELVHKWEVGQVLKVKAILPKQWGSRLGNNMILNEIFGYFFAAQPVL